MKIAKICLYCSNVYNLLPTVLLTPLYSMTVYETPAPASKMGVPMSEYYPNMVIRPQPYWLRRGFRLTFLFLRFHAGIEVHYTTDTDGEK